LINTSVPTGKWHERKTQEDEKEHKLCQSRNFMKQESKQDECDYPDGRHEAVSESLEGSISVIFEKVIMDSIWAIGVASIIA